MTGRAAVEVTAFQVARSLPSVPVRPTAKLFGALGTAWAVTVTDEPVTVSALPTLLEGTIVKV